MEPSRISLGHISPQNQKRNKIKFCLKKEKSILGPIRHSQLKAQNNDIISICVVVLALIEDYLFFIFY